MFCEQVGLGTIGWVLPPKACLILRNDDTYEHVEEGVKESHCNQWHTQLEARDMKLPDPGGEGLSGAGWCGVVWGGVRWGGVGWGVMDWSGLRWGGMESIGLVWGLVGWCGVEWAGLRRGGEVGSLGVVCNAVACGVVGWSGWGGVRCIRVE